jgi:hypothetical protein
MEVPSGTLQNIPGRLFEARQELGKVDLALRFFDFFLSLVFQVVRFY